MKPTECNHCQIDGCERKSLISDLKSKYEEVFAAFCIVKDNLHAEGFLEGLSYALDQIAQKLRDKPLTLDEAFEERAIWVEKKFHKSSILTPKILVIKDDRFAFTREGDKYPVELYGVTWRAWIRKPTKNDRSYAEWEVKRNGKQCK